jgi:hypothetical protein
VRRAGPGEAAPSQKPSRSRSSKQVRDFADVLAASHEGHAALDVPSYLVERGHTSTTIPTWNIKSLDTLVEAQIAQGEWTDPVRAKVRLSDYAERWIAERPGLRPRTVELYQSLLRRHVTPWLGDVPLGKLDTPLIREWRSRLLDEGASATVAAKAYRLLRAVLMTAVNEDRLIPRNPCQVRGADREVAGERPVLSVAKVLALADAVPARHRAMVLVTTFGSLRFGGDGAGTS